MAHWKPVSEWQQLHVHVGVSCLLQHALGLHSILRHLYELELDHGGVPEPDSGTTVEEVEVEDQEVMHATALDHCYQSLAGRFSGGPRGKKKGAVVIYCLCWCWGQPSKLCDFCLPSIQRHGDDGCV